ncbi:MurR/RpiR family transcriptional regulator [Amphritea sp. 1_MG-2023]|uniref:MurR/RpiR family transcriptional regulator n=1 Tax=Amphritea sp. 1_MG-2023 TaxID=3062670 RepID=UPI0026E36175|nr:MurR/RpiR family transcriptional regulator [Amphritea sp. 1_MG-2023]MDO6565072.1 MurR/RpiR family transcriptional regulator [Amphritea sp. 1_MG-2023]
MTIETSQPQHISDADRVLKQLASLYPTLTTQLKKAADFILEHPVEVALLSIRKSAETASVTPSTMTRLAKTLGFERYDSFRQLFQEAIHTKAPSSFSQRAESLQNLASNNTENNVLSEFSTTTFNNLEHCFQEDTLTKLELAAPMIVNARKVFAIGFRDTFACAHHFAYVGQIAFPHIKLIRGYQGTLLTELAEINAQDVVIVFGSEPYAIDTVNALKIVREAGAKIIAVTDSLRSPLAAEAEIVFTLNNETPHFFGTLVPVIALIEALLSVCVSLGGSEIVHNINQFEENLRRLGGYYTP